MRVGGLILLLLAVGSAGVGAKDKPAFVAGYQYPAKPGILEQPVAPGIVLRSRVKFERAEFSFRPEAYQKIVRSSSKTHLDAPQSLTANASEEAGWWRAVVEPSITVAKDGEYLLHWEAKLVDGKRMVRKMSGTLAVLAQDGKLWFGGDSIDLAYVECLKHELGIQGEPRGKDLAQLNRKWAKWLEERQVKARAK